MSIQYCVVVETPDSQPQFDSRGTHRSTMHAVRHLQRKWRRRGDKRRHHKTGLLKISWSKNLSIFYDARSYVTVLVPYSSHECLGRRCYSIGVLYRSLCLTVCRLSATAKDSPIVYIEVEYEYVDDISIATIFDPLGPP